MCLVSGYLLQQKGAFLAQIAVQKSKEMSDSKWVTVFDSKSELNVVFHPKYRRFQMDIINCDYKPSEMAVDNPQMQQPSEIIHDYCDDLENFLRGKRKYTFVLNYGMNVSPLNSGEDKLQNELEEAWKEGEMFNQNEEEKYYQAPKIQMDSESIQLLEIL